MPQIPFIFLFVVIVVLLFFCFFISEIVWLCGISFFSSLDFVKKFLEFRGGVRAFTNWIKFEQLKKKKTKYKWSRIA